MRKIILIITCIAYYHTGIACYNEAHFDKKGKQTGRDLPFSGFFNSPDTGSAKEYLDQHPLSKINSYDWETQSDIAVKLAYLGRLSESLQILRRLQRSMPNDYTLAANLGTTYELLGQNDSALLYIKKGLQVNPNSHEGSEWVHVKILEAKLAVAKDPDWLATHSVLGTGVTFSSPKADSFDRWASHVEYQLQERVPFTPFPDRLLANVFNEWGDLLATQQSVKVAHIAYQFSLINDESDPYGVKSKLDWLKAMMKKNKMKADDWNDHYFTRDYKPAPIRSEEEFTNDVLPFTTDSAKTTTTIRGTEEEKSSKTLIYILAGACTLLLGYLGIYFYRQKRSGRV